MVEGRQLDRLSAIGDAGRPRAMPGEGDPASLPIAQRDQPTAWCFGEDPVDRAVDGRPGDRRSWGQSDGQERAGSWFQVESSPAPGRAIGAKDAVQPGRIAPGPPWPPGIDDPPSPTEPTFRRRVQRSPVTLIGVVDRSRGAKVEERSTPRNASDVDRLESR